MFTVEKDGLREEVDDMTVEIGKSCLDSGMGSSRWDICELRMVRIELSRMYIR